MGGIPRVLRAGPPIPPLGGMRPRLWVESPGSSVPGRLFRLWAGCAPAYGWNPPGPRRRATYSASGRDAPPPMGGIPPGSSVTGRLFRLRSVFSVSLIGLGKGVDEGQYWLYLFTSAGLSPGSVVASDGYSLEKD